MCCRWGGGNGREGGEGMGRNGEEGCRGKRERKGSLDGASRDRGLKSGVCHFSFDFLCLFFFLYSVDGECCVALLFF